MRLCLCLAVAGLTFTAASLPATAATSAPIATALAASDTLSRDAESASPSTPTPPYAYDADDGDSDFAGPASASFLGPTPFLPVGTASSGPSHEQIYSLGAAPSEGISFEMPAFDTDHDGKVQCVELLKGLLNAPRTIFWKPGRSVMDADDIKPGTAIATFVNGQYPQGPIKGSKHAAIFLRKVKDGIFVLDQYVGQRLAKTRFIPWHNTTNARRANNGHTYSTVVW